MAELVYKKRCQNNIQAPTRKFQPKVTRAITLKILYHMAQFSHAPYPRPDNHTGYRDGSSVGLADGGSLDTDFVTRTIPLEVSFHIIV